MWEEDKVGWRCGKVKGDLEVYLCLGEFDLQLGLFPFKCHSESVFTFSQKVSQSMVLLQQVVLFLHKNGLFAFPKEDIKKKKHLSRLRLF